MILLTTVSFCSVLFIVRKIFALSVCAGTVNMLVLVCICICIYIYIVHVYHLNLHDAMLLCINVGD